MNQTIQATKNIRYLALGDSYTIGEGVSKEDSWPVLLSHKLKSKSIHIEELNIIAKTGWTCNGLKSNIAPYLGQPNSYDLISLSIGVNDQYDGKTLDEYQKSFAELLDMAMVLTEDKSNIFVLSIPDYSVTPFVEDNKKERISNEIKAFNDVNRKLSMKKGVKYFDVINLTKGASYKQDFVEDKLHPNKKIYTAWVTNMIDDIRAMLMEESF